MVNRVLIFSVFTFLLYSTTIYAATFKGKVIDADTKEPIGGAVVVASWSESTATITGGSQRSKDVKETLTNKNGEWEIKGPKGDRFIAQVFAMIPSIYYTEAPEFIVFKPGYCSYPAGFGIEACKEKMKVYNFTNSDNIGEIVELPRVTNREDRKRSLPGTAGFSRESDKKQINFLKLINEEHKNIFGKGDLEDYIEELENEK
ncbi:MAG: hypothetical protein HY752_03675 [Nitrospirae bacterium]|nr:hypothetical protein [Nitrospirota bacterium]